MELHAWPELWFAFNSDWMMRFWMAAEYDGPSVALGSDAVPVALDAFPTDTPADGGVLPAVPNSLPRRRTSMSLIP